ncbi:MAG TPA: histidine kinase [Flavisolibacter sp.]|jgi:sensor histidine kinase YesM|nr:histidine kinase [Flavisolibacter sp.]
MKKYKRVNLVIRIWVILIISIIGWFNANLFNDFFGAANLKMALFLLVSNTLIFETCRWVLSFIYRGLQENTGVTKRLVIVFFTSYITATLVRLGLIHIRSFLFDISLQPFGHMVSMALIMTMPITWIILAVNELLFITEQTGKIEQEKEELAQVNLQQQYDSLKEQVNPHFLFNNLNSLITLISKDPERADSFVEEMSVVYRYLLRNNQGNTTSLKEEIRFIESYNHLLKTRFGQGFQSSIRIEPAAMNDSLPPMTLQLLVENAVKHNIVSADKPLYLQLYTKNGNLVVQNNLQKKTRAVASNKVGLSNINAKYKLLKQPPVTIQETADSFTVTIPLIKNNEAHL